MEGCLPHGAPVLHVPAVLGEHLGVGLVGLALDQAVQQRAALELEVKSSISKSLVMIKRKTKVKLSNIHPNFIKLL